MTGPVIHQVSEASLDPRVAGSAPCLGCRHQSRCQLEKLGCEALIMHAKGASAERIRYAPRQPSKEAMARAVVPAKIKPRKRAPRTVEDLTAEE